MIKKLSRFLKKDVYFVYATHLSFLAGSLLAGFRSGNFIRPNLILGICIFFLAFVLKALLDYLTSNKINPYTKINLSRQDNKTSLMITTRFLFMMLFLILYLLLQQKILIGVNLIYIVLIFTLFFFLLRLSGKYLRKYDIILEALIVSLCIFCLNGLTA